MYVFGNGTNSERKNVLLFYTKSAFAKLEWAET